MKNKVTLLTFYLLLVTAFSFSQQKIEASKIIKDIKDGKSIAIKNATIIGVLDFTFMDEALKNNVKTKKSSSWFNWGSNNNSSNEVKKYIENEISFINCTFKNDVLAYIPDEDSGYTFTASFKNNAIFKNCTFNQKAMFKYSRFEKDADFSGSSFNDDSTFKYAKFDKDISFNNTTFDEIATFKYTKFNNSVSFSDAVFHDTAIFKYTNFSNGVSFRNTNFKEDLNIKYMKVTGNFDVSNMKVAYNVDSKYTKINGNSFSKYLIKND
ncbi:pentapeptide repeat-containing protein [Polaribacter sargassicola]|uniref:pentapeptide repeat-containing protein n=1 Tax=Polaribacter sargassicola TaxID=2836891 RepID=UPI001F3535D3|nr:pentapeptide repeat-containing protein [Polaribacter sp. DS7-9]MCG1036982.1 pentapeptide repeat-containing protein [Polaribacter sp. DS7-9]